MTQVVHRNEIARLRRDNPVVHLSRKFPVGNWRRFEEAASEFRNFALRGAHRPPHVRQRVRNIWEVKRDQDAKMDTTRPRSGGKFSKSKNPARLTPRTGSTRGATSRVRRNKAGLAPSIVHPCEFIFTQRPVSSPISTKVDPSCSATRRTALTVAVSRHSQ